MYQNLLSEATKTNLQEAIFNEFTASQTYKHLSNQMQRLGYFGAASYFAFESSDELEHYGKLKDYINDRGNVATIPALDALETNVTDLGAALRIAYDMELSLNRKYEQWYREALDEDITTAQFLLQFIEIQRTSVGEYGDWLARYDLTGFNSASVLMIDNEMGSK